MSDISIEFPTLKGFNHTFPAKLPHLVAMETSKLPFSIYLCIITLHLHRSIIIPNYIEILPTIFILQDKMFFFTLSKILGWLPWKPDYLNPDP